MAISPAFRRVTHTLAQHKLAYLSDRECSTSRFRQITREMGMLLAQEVLRDWPSALATAKTSRASDEPTVFNIIAEKVVVVPILRAGLVLAEGALEILGTAHVGHIGIGRHADNYADVVEYLVSLPNPEGQLFILMDSVIGTGATACKAIKTLGRAGVPQELIRFATILVTEEGLKEVAKECGDVLIYGVAVQKLDRASNHIIPGLGDTAERLFGGGERNASTNT